jgi:hypothetical protein
MRLFLDLMWRHRKRVPPLFLVVGMPEMSCAALAAWWGVSQIERSSMG